LSRHKTEAKVLKDMTNAKSRSGWCTTDRQIVEWSNSKQGLERLIDVNVDYCWSEPDTN